MLIYLTLWELLPPSSLVFGSLNWTLMIHILVVSLTLKISDRLNVSPLAYESDLLGHVSKIVGDA